MAAAVALLLMAWAGLRLYDRPPGPPGGWLARLGLEEHFATVAGVRVRYVRTGEGPPVVLLHGFGSSIYTWKDVMPGLARDHEIVALDLPGFGWSDQPADLSFELFPRVVLGLLDQLSIRRVSLVGNSMGGAVACWVAASEPGRVDRLVLIDSAGFNLRAADRPAMVRLTAHPWAEAIAGRLPVTRLLVTLGLRHVFHDDTRLTEERVDEYLAAARRPGTLRSIRSLMASYRGAAGEFPTLLGRIRAPTLVVWGQEDEWIPLSHADRFVAAITGARKVVLPGVGHVPEEEAPKEVTRLVLDFLGGSHPPLLVQGTRAKAPSENSRVQTEDLRGTSASLELAPGELVQVASQATASGRSRTLLDACLPGGVVCSSTPAARRRAERSGR